MDKYLLLILKEVNTIIIPDLGALTVTSQSTGEIMFMPYLKYDDGKLAAYIAEKENMEVNDAKNLIAKHVREILNLLDKGESYEMFQFGTFYKDTSGDIQFRNWDGSLPSERKVEKEVVFEEVKHEQSSSLSIEEIEESTIELPVDNKSSKENPIEVQEVAEEVIAVTEPIVEKVTEVEPEIPVQEQVVDEQVENPIPEEVTSAVEVSSNKILVDLGPYFSLELEQGFVHGIIKKDPDNYIPAKENQVNLSIPFKKEEAPKQAVVEEKPVEVVETKVADVPVSPVVEEPKVEKEEVKPNIPKPKELSPEEAEAKRKKDEERAAERERRLAERMEKLEAKRSGESIPESPAAETASQEAKETPKAPEVKEEKKPSKKEKEPKPLPEGRTFVVVKTQNQLSSIRLALVILAIGISGGLFSILYPFDNLKAAPEMSTGKELAANNKNITPAKPKSSTSETIIIEKSTDENSAEDVSADVEETPAPVEPIKEEPTKPVKATKPVEKPKAKPVVAEVSTPAVSGSGAFHIIGGAFSTKHNAEKFVTQMQTKGFSAAFVLGKVDNMFVVSIGSYSTKAEAKAANIANHVKGWIFKSSH